MNIDDIINNHFDGNKEDPLSAQDLFSLIEEQFSKFKKSTSTLQTEAKSSTKEHRRAIPYPQLRITNDWGKPGTQEREMVDMFVNRIQADATENTIQGRVASLANFVNSCSEETCRYQTIPEILSFITLLDVFSAIRYKFEAQAAGWMFESFVAAIIGGTQETDTTGSSLPIEDVVMCMSTEEETADEETCLTQKAFSLKFVRPGSSAGGTNVELLKVGIENYGSVEYVIGEKRQDGVNFSFVEITPENFDVAVNIGSNGKSWSINKAAIESKIGMALPTEDEIIDIARDSLSRLNQGVTLIYDNMSVLSEELTDYFVNENKLAATNAIAQSRELAQNVNDYIK
jgi:hypothetical protein